MCLKSSSIRIEEIKLSSNLWQGQQQSAIYKPHILRQYPKLPPSPPTICHKCLPQFAASWALTAISLRFSHFSKDFSSILARTLVRQRGSEVGSAIQRWRWLIDDSDPAPIGWLGEGRRRRVGAISVCQQQKKRKNFYCIYWGRIVWATNWSIFCSSKRLPDRIAYRIYPAKQPSKLLVYFGIYSLYFLGDICRWFSVGFCRVKVLFYFFCFIQGWLHVGFISAWFYLKFLRTNFRNILFIDWLHSLAGLWLMDCNFCHLIDSTDEIYWFICLFYVSMICW